MIYMFLANGFEEVEALAPLDLLIRAGADIKTVAVGCDGKTVTGAHGIGVEADITEGEIVYENIEMVILPGGMPGATNLDESGTVDKMLAYAAENGAYLAAICAAPMVLGKRGYLEGKKAVCYPGFEEYLIGAKLSSDKVVRDGNVITAIGMGAALEFGLVLTDALYGRETAEKIRTSTKI